MNATQELHDLGQSLWLDNITRRILDDGSLEQLIRERSITGLTSNPSIFDKALKSDSVYDQGIRSKVAEGKSGEPLFFELAIEDLVRAADLFRPVHERTDGRDGWVSLEVSPLLANDAAASVRAAARLHAQANRPNLFIKIPGTPEGLVAIEESIFAGIPVNVTLLFSALQYVAAAEAYMRGLERRLSVGLPLRVFSVASLFVSRWDAAIHETAPVALRNRLGVAIARQAYGEYRRLLASSRWKALSRAGAPDQRLLWASTGTKDAALSDTFYVESLAAPDTINTMPSKTLDAFTAHGHVGASIPVDGGNAEQVLAAFSDAGVDCLGLASRLQVEGTEAFDNSWRELLERLATKQASLAPRPGVGLPEGARA